MRDPHIHVEKTPMPGFGHPAMRALITEAIGVVPDLPKTVGTGCGRRRPIGMTSTVPERVTCLGCRDWARAEFLTWADIASAAVALTREPGYHGLPAADLRDEECLYRELAARFEVTR